MFKGMMRRGLHDRLVAKGVNPVVAYELANVVYPGSDLSPSRPAVVGAKEAAGVVEDFLNRGAITEQQMIARIWGDRGNRLES